jgi:hypothetical protein
MVARPVGVVEPDLGIHSEPAIAQASTIPKSAKTAA